MRNLFGSDLPPGCSTNDIERAQGEGNETAEECPNCDNQACTPFTMNRTWREVVYQATAFRCNDCGAEFFNHIAEQEELAAIRAAGYDVDERGTVTSRSTDAGSFRAARHLEVELLTLNEIITVREVSRVPLTRKRLLMTYNQGGKLIDKTHQDPEWWKTGLALFQRVYAVGATPEKAIRALGKQVGWGRVYGFESQPIEDTEMAPFQSWYYRFWSGTGTSMKAGGRFVPGGVILDWWK